jgi:hypothetical protein
VKELVQDAAAKGGAPSCNIAFVFEVRSGLHASTVWQIGYCVTVIGVEETMVVLHQHQIIILILIPTTIMSITTVLDQDDDPD